jgi:glucose/arabinose dehydrogenase
MTIPAERLHAILRVGWAGLVLILAAGLAACGGQSDSANSSSSPLANLECASDNGSLTLPEGFCATVLADSLGRVRHIAVNENGDVYAALRQVEGGGIVALRDTDGDGTADVEERFGESGGTGIGIRDGYLYFAPDSAVWRYQMTEGELVPTGEREVVASGFPEQSSHAVKPFAFDGSGNMYVNVGAPSNACQEQSRTAGSPGQDPCPQLERQAGIWRFSADQLNQTQEEHSQRYATGIRNAVALTWNDNANSLYVVQHGRDQLRSLWPDLYTQEESNLLPASEFFKVDDGDDFGWPYCYYDQAYDNQKELAPEYGGDGSDVGRCDQFEDPISTAPGHFAPNDVKFYTGDHFPAQYQNGAFIAYHGSWNRQPQQAGYQVSFLPFDGDMPSGEQEKFADGFAGDGDFRPQNPADAEYRPMGLAVGPHGTLYISDSVQGRIWRVTYTGS